MKRIFYLCIAVLFLATLACAQNDNVSLGDAARAARVNKTQASPNAKVYDNDNLPTGGAISTTTGDFAGVAASKDDKDSKDKTAAKGGKDKTGDNGKSTQEQAFKDKAADLKKNIDQLSRELDVMQREQRLKAAAYYGDAGTKLRNQQQYQDDEKKYQSDLSAKQDQLSQAKQQLDDLREQVRQAGLPASIAE
jgi:hypothetical protein